MSAVSRNTIFTVSGGSQTVHVMENLTAATVGVVPAAGASALVEFSLSALCDIENSASNVVWYPWTAGVVTVQTAGIFDGKVAAIRVTAIAASVYVEVCK